jgi:surface polysaccharide O-acyltransferase-like enzyme
MSANVKNRLLYIDALRVAATGLVVALHCITELIVSASYYGTKSWFACVALNGLCRAGVPIFFMLSGYLALNSGKTANIKLFYHNKLIRLLPPLFI